MAFTDVFIKKRVLGIAIALALLLVGCIAFNLMAVRQFPVVNLPIITITTNYPGADPSVMQGFVTQPIEQAITGVDGVDYITAANTQGSSTITVWLHVGADISGALTDINSKISSVRWKLPKDINDPEIVKGGVGAPILYLTVGSDTVSKLKVTDYIYRNMLPALQGLPGVQSILVYARNYAMRLWLNPNKMHALGVTADDLLEAVNKSNLQAPLGKLENSQQEFDLQSNSGLQSAKEFNQLVIRRDKNGHIIRFRDIGYAQLGADNTLIRSWTGYYKQSVTLAVLTQNTANNIALSKKIRTMLPEMQKRMPPGVGVKVLWDTSKFSVKSIHLVIETVWEAVICVMIVIFLFLGSMRALVTPIITIPLSLIGACVFMYLLGFSINTFTLLAFVLSIGLVVDDAIVILENIHRHIEMGKEKVIAAMEATREIMMPIIAMTLVVAVVFIPIAFTSGIISPLFREFGLTLTITVLLSGFFALTLSPMMTASLFKDSSNQGKFVHFIDKTFSKVEHGYQNFLTKVFKIRPIVIILVLTIFVACGYIMSKLPGELIPDEDQGVVLSIGTAPTSASLEYMTRYNSLVSSILKTVPEMRTYGVVIGFMGINELISFLIMRDPQPGDRSEEKLMKSLQKKLDQVPGLKMFAFNRPALANITGLTSPVQFVLQTSGGYNQLYTVTQKILKRMTENTKLLNVTSDLKIDKPDFNITIDRLRAADLGVSIKSITDTLGVELGQPTIGWFGYHGWSYPIIPRVQPAFHQLPNNIANLSVRLGEDEMMPLSNLVTLENKVVPQNLNEFQNLRSATISANLAQGYTQGQALAYMRGLVQDILPSNMKYDYAGSSRQYVQASGQALMIFATAIMAIYLLLIIKFDSFLDPLIVMISVPLSTLGALFAIYASGFTLNIYTKIGLVMLIGLISKHGILIVNFANYLQKDNNYDIRTAVLEAAKIRLRPILMTTAAMIFGSIPLALASGTGHEALRQMGIVLIGGLSFGSLLTLFVVPTFYTLLAKDFNVKPDETSTIPRTT